MGGGLLAAVAWTTGLTQWDPEPLTLATLGIIAMLFFVPSLLEEMLFRGALHPAPDAPHRPFRILVAAALFVMWHPLQLWSGIGPDWSALFVSTAFLACVTIGALTLGLLREVSGSLWPPILFHWAMVTIWKLLLGGPF